MNFEMSRVEIEVEIGAGVGWKDWFGLNWIGLDCEMNLFIFMKMFW